MRTRATRATSAGAVLLAVGTVGVLLAQEKAPPAPAAPQPGPSLHAELAYSEPIAFDYDRDGKPNRVQFWIEIEARPAPGEPGTEVEGGSLKYFVYDLESKRRIDNWMAGFTLTMGGDFPRPGEAYPLTNVRIEGRTAHFDFNGATWTLTDGGPSWKTDPIEIRDYRGTRKARFLGGDVRVVGGAATAAKPVDVAANKECNGCHEDAALTMAAEGGPHRELECAACHTKHPPDVEGVVVPECTSCHESHSESMGAASCAECHAGHAVAKVKHAPTMPDAYCTACHAGVAETLRASRSRHMGVKCVLCHQKEHASPATACVFCHRGSHPEHVMSKAGVCASCHKTAHDLRSARAR
jgi:hypothetical protein